MNPSITSGLTLPIVTPPVDTFSKGLGLVANKVPLKVPALTCRHDVVSEERSSEPQRQHQQVAVEAWEQTPEARRMGAEVAEGSSHQHTVRMEAQDVVVAGVQVCGLDQLETTRETRVTTLMILMYFYMAVDNQ